MIYWILFYLIGFLLCFYLLGSDFFRYQYEIDVKLKGRIFGSFLSWILVIIILLELWGCALLYYQRNNEFFNYQGKTEEELCKGETSSKKKKSFKKNKGKAKKIKKLRVSE